MRYVALLAWLVMLPLLSYGQAKEDYAIGMLLDFRSAEMEPLLDALRQEIVAVVGEDATIRFPENSVLVNNFDGVLAETHYQTLLANETDLIIAFGPINNVVISRKPTHAKPTILFGSVNKDVVAIDTTQTTSGIDNFTYLISWQSYARDLQTFKTLYDFEQVGVIVEGPSELAQSLRTTLDQTFGDLDASYTLIPYTSPASLMAVVDQIDAVYLAEGFSIPVAERAQLAQILIDNRLPSFTATPREDVERGWMATNQSDESIDQFFRRIALSVEAVVNGQNLATLPIFIDFNERLTLNFNTAQLVDVPLKYSMIATTDLVADFNTIYAERTYSLVDVIQGVLDANLSLASSRKEVALAEQDVKTARSNYLPSLTASGTGTYIDPDLAEASNGQNPEYSTSGNVTLTQTLFSEGANANITIQNNLLQAQRANFEAAELDAILDGANAYFNVLILKANLQIRKQNLEVTRRNLHVAEQNFEAGQSGQADVLRFRSEMAQNMQALVEAINQLESGFHVLNLILNNPIEFRINVEGAAIAEGVFEDYNYEQLELWLDDSSQREVFINFLVDVALENAPELDVLDYNLEVIRRTIQLNGPRRFIPTVAAQAQYNRTFDQWGTGSLPSDVILKDNYNVGLSLSIPIFDGNREHINRQTAQIQQEQLAINRENTTQALERNVRDAVLDLINQIANIQLSQVSEDAAAQGLALTETAYSNGAVTIVQLIDAQTNHLQAQLARATANYNYLLSAMLLERTIGYYFLLHTPAENDAFIQRFADYQQARQAQR